MSISKKELKQRTDILLENVKAIAKGLADTQRALGAKVISDSKGKHAVIGPMENVIDRINRLEKHLGIEYVVETKVERFEGYRNIKPVEIKSKKKK